MEKRALSSTQENMFLVNSTVLPDKSEENLLPSAISGGYPKITRRFKRASRSSWEYFCLSTFCGSCFFYALDANTRLPLQAVYWSGVEGTRACDWLWIGAEPHLWPTLSGQGSPQKLF